MKTLIFFIFFIPSHGIAQNLVLNGSFESFSLCPNSAGQINSASSWRDPCPYGTSDYFNSCCVQFGSYGVPMNCCGIQNAHSGDAYAGIVVADLAENPSYREYLEVKLSSALEFGKCYEFELFWCLGEYCSRYQVADIGVFFSPVELTNLAYTTGPIPYTPQINNSLTNRPDTATWKSVMGNFYASGGEQYLVIGNFNTSVTDTVLFNSGSYSKLSYVYIDDVSLRLCQDVSVPANEMIQNRFVKQKNGCFTLEKEAQAQLMIWNMQGINVFKDEMVKDAAVCPELPAGIYGYKIRGQSGNAQAGKLVIPSR